MRKQSGHGMNRRDFDRLLERQRRQNSRHAPRHHRLSRAGRTDGQQVVAACAGDFERATRQELTADIGEIGDPARRHGRWRRRPRERDRRGLVQRADGVGERRHRIDASPDTIAASLAFEAGRRRPEAPPRRAAAAIGSTPRAGCIEPSSESSPSRIRSPMSRRSTMPCAASTPSAIGRSKEAPAFRTSAGARLTVIGAPETRSRNCESRSARGRGSRGRWCRAGRPS